ncbi:MEKHLA domain-containing protein [Actinoplanes sp. NPDC051411]|uniref:MEKHLA domain-containing protein n=1 Tax=Actinoplanes sp. NPDC051411 TaxID=3155522 RepID=UPI003419A5AF
MNAAFADMLADSYLKLLGEPLVPDGRRGAEAAAWLDDAPFGLLAHDTSPDPLFVYANRKAQEAFGYRRDEFTGLPSRLSAGEEDRASRHAFIDSVRRKGYATGYRGPRVARDGHQFWIEDVTLWNLFDAGGTLAGQAALIPRTS